MSGDSVSGRGETGGGAGSRNSGDGRTRADRIADRAASARATVLDRGASGLASAIRSVQTALARPTASDVATIGCTLAIALVVGSTLVGVGLAVLAVLAGLGAALVTVLLASDRPLVRTLGGAIAVPVSVVFAAPAVLAGALVATGGVEFFAGIAVWALVVAALASGLVSWKRLGNGGARRGATGTMLASTGVIAVVVLRVLPESAVHQRAGAAASAIGGALWSVLVAADGSWALVWFVALLFVTVVAVRLTLAYVPFERLLPPDRRDGLSTIIGTIQRACSHVARLSVLLVLAAFAAPAVSDRLEDIPVSPSELAAELPASVGVVLASVATASPLRLGLLAVLGATASLAALEWVRRTFKRNVALVVARLCAPAVGGAVVATVLAVVLSDAVLAVEPAAEISGTAPGPIVDLVAALPPLALAAAVLVPALGTLASALLGISTLRAIRLLPARAIGGALAAGSVFALAVGLVAVGRIELAIATAGGALVLWDVGEYADSIRTELGREADTIRAELVHVGGSLLSGAAVVSAVLAVYWAGVAQLSVADPAAATVALGAGLLAVVLVAWALRA
ncbi:hypothetical protein ACLI4Z_01765 [Natrialbaceae archaeon A-arb3/5]